jgi:signal transduction histidine kinase
MTMKATNSERGAIQLYNEEEQGFRPYLSSGFAPEEEADWHAAQLLWLEPAEDQYHGFIKQIREGHATLVSAEQCPDQADIFYQTMILAAPIKYNDRMHGLLMLDRSSTLRRESARKWNPGDTRILPRHEFSLWDIAVTEGIAQFAGLAIEQARWHHEAEIARTNEASMRESNKLKDEFLAITAHEFRTPLTIILAYNQMMARTLKKSAEIHTKTREKLQESIDNIEIQTHQLTNIVNTFLEVTRLNRGQITLVLEELDLREVIKEAVHMHRKTSTQHTIAYKFTDDASYQISGDRARLLQIFANLLQNAIKYSPFGGPITVALQKQQLDDGSFHAEIRVQDKGIGIPKEAQSRLFERFYRAPNIEGSKTRGVGLGLYVVSEFLRLHGGSIRVESSGITGEGSCFILTLPLLVERHNNGRTEKLDT